MQYGYCTCLELVVLSLVIETQMVISGLKLKETKAKDVAMATSQYSTLRFDVGFKFQLSLSGDIPRFMICVHSQSIYDGINFQMSRTANGMASASSCRNHDLSCRGKF